MSTHYYAVCPSHEVYHVLGVTTAGRFHSANGSKDDEGHQQVDMFLFEHSSCTPYLRIVDEHCSELECLVEINP